MQLGLRMLDNVASVNFFNYADQVSFMAGDTVTVYFQLIDLSQDRLERGYFPGGRRFVPAVGATLTVTVDNIDDAIKVANRVATQPFANDASIWSFSVTAADSIQGTCALRIVLNQSGTVTRGAKEAAVLISSFTP